VCYGQAEGVVELLIDDPVCEAEMISLCYVAYEAWEIAIAHEINTYARPSKSPWTRQSDKSLLLTRSQGERREEEGVALRAQGGNR
jgi:hypothetical protein